MNPPGQRYRARRGVHAVLSLAALGTFGCDDSTYYHYGYYPITCDSGVTEGSIDTDAILDLVPGEGVGATVEYSGDGAWRFAVACDSLVSGYACDWTVLVGSIDGTIDVFDPEGLEPGDVVERYPTTSGSSVEDGVILFATTDVGIDAFTVLATPGTGMRVRASIGGYCAGPYVFWSEDGDARTSPTETIELFPDE